MLAFLFLASFTLCNRLQTHPNFSFFSWSKAVCWTLFPGKGSGRDNRHLLLPTVCWPPGNGNKGSTDPAFRRFMVPLESKRSAGAAGALRREAAHSVNQRRLPEEDWVPALSFECWRVWLS